jgi:hypothetical protein
MRHSTTLTRYRSVRALIGTAVLAGALGACAAGASNVPSIPLPSDLGTMSLPTFGPAGSDAGCLDAVTASLVSQLPSPGPDLDAALTQDSPALVAGLQALQPADAATATWRDQLVTALQAGETATASTKIQMLLSGEVSLPTC